jgi:pimeloyl-ACP methyl ester carboxylesterase
MQLAYQFPERCERLVLVDSGGLGRELNMLLRAATLPLSEIVLPLLASTRLLDVGRNVGRVFGRLGLHAGTDMAELARGHASLEDPEARAAFVHTLRTIVDPLGQRVNATDRLYLAENIPFLIVWGERDPIIPVAHGRAAHAAMPGSRLELFERSGHFPHQDDALRFVELLRGFVAGTEPARLDAETLRERIRAGGPLAA